MSELSRRAVDLIDRREFADAERTLGEALAVAPENPTCLFNLACVHAAMHQARAAVEDLNRAAEAGFTDFSLLERNPIFGEVRTLPEYATLVSRKAEIAHRAAGRIVGELRERLGDKYLIDADEKRKFVFAARTSREALDALEKSLREQAAAQAQTIFSNPSDEFIRVILATPADFARLESRPGVGGLYDDATRTLLVRRTGPELRHEFTHAIHAADQHALGQAHPVWLSEGLATLYESPRVEPGAAGGDKMVLPNDTWRLAAVQAAARRNTLIPLDKLLEMKRDAFTARADLAYGEAGSLLMYLFDRQKLKAFYEAYVAGYGQDASGRAALEKVSGEGMEELQTKWVRWLLPRAAPARGAR